MKKYSFLLAAAAVLIPLAVSCNKSGSTTDTEKEIVVPPAPMAPYAKKIVLDTPTEIVLDKHSYQLQKVEVTETGRYIVTGSYLSAVESSVKSTKGSTPFDYLSGTYSTKDGISYELKDFGTVKFTNNQLTYTGKNGAPVNAKAGLAPQLLSGLASSLAHDWKIDKTDVSVTAGSGTVGVVKNGCDLPAIAADLNAKGLKIDTDLVAGYVVEKISFTSFRTIQISFTNKDPFVGEFTLNDATGALSYTLEGSVGNYIFNGTASGSAKLLSKDSVQLTMNIKVESGSETYSGRAIFILSPIA